MTTSIVPAASAALAPAGGARLIPVTPGFEDFDGSEFRLPRLAVVQTAKQMTEWDAKQGQIHHSITGANDKEVIGIVLATKKPRWYGPDFEASEKTRAAGGQVQAWCKSSNGIVPDADSPQKQAAACKLCPLGRGTKNSDGSFTPPACTEMRKVLLGLEDGSFATLVAKKGGCREIDTALQPFLMAGKPPSAFHWSITTRKEEGKGNTWFVPVLRPLRDRPVTAEDQERLMAMLPIYLPLLGSVDAADSHGDEEPAPPAGDIPPAPSFAEAAPMDSGLNAQSMLDDPDAPF